MKKLLALLLPALFIMPVQADLLGTTDNLFNSMINVTGSGAAQSQSRGVLAGPSVSVRNRISNVNLVNFQAPNVDAGCGGVDIFGGSFSFINADQFSQMLRNIAANATGYAFGLALNAMCPTCKQEMDKLQKMINSMNKAMMDSCSMAKWMVDQSSLDEIADQRMSEAQRENKSVLTDWFDASFLDNLPWKTAADAGSDVGQFNTAKQAMDAQNLQSWYSGGDEQFKMKLVSFLGTVTSNYDAADPESKPDMQFWPPTIDLRDLLEGNDDATLYACVGGVNNCAEMQENAGQRIYGLKEYVKAIMSGTATSPDLNIEPSPGIFVKFQTNTGPLTDSETRFIETAPAPVAAMLRNLARLNSGAGDAFIEQSSELIALEWTLAMSKDFIKASMAAVLNSEDVPGKKFYLQKLQERRAELAKEYMEASKKVENATVLYANYMTLEKTFEPRQHGITTPAKK